jgi:Gpi18-like mannosyltransferase
MVQRVQLHRVELAKDSRVLVKPWYEFDAFWYVDIAMRGYSTREPGGALLGVAFMPLLPGLIRLSSMLGADPYLAGLLLPNLAFVIGLVAFAQTVYDLTGSESRAWRACVLLTSCPTAFFFSAPYQESLGFALSAVFLLCWVNGRYVVAAVALARQSALMWGVALVVQWGIDWWKGRNPSLHAWFVALAGLIAFAGYLAFLKYSVGVLPTDAHGAWGRDSPGLWPLLSALTSGFRAPTFDWFAGIGVLAVGVYALRKRGALWSALIVFPPLLAMSTGSVLSLKRHVLASFPAFLDIEELAEQRLLFYGLICLGWILQVVLLRRFVADIFVG